MVDRVRITMQSPSGGSGAVRPDGMRVEPIPEWQSVGCTEFTGDVKDNKRLE
jgi:hypothetical protein